MNKDANQNYFLIGTGLVIALVALILALAMSTGGGQNGATQQILTPVSAIELTIAWQSFNATAQAAEQSRATLQAEYQVLATDVPLGMAATMDNIEGQLTRIASAQNAAGTQIVNQAADVEAVSTEVDALWTEVADMAATSAAGQATVQMMVAIQATDDADPCLLTPFAGGAAIRAEADLDATAISYLPFGEEIRTRAHNGRSLQDNRWWYVELEMDGRPVSGWISSVAVTNDDTPACARVKAWNEQLD